MQAAVLAIILTTLSFLACAQKQWAGSISGKWEDAKNWQPQGVPLPGDDVLLDNRYQRSGYRVTMPDTTVIVHLLSIEPETGSEIELLIPVSNKGSPALIVNSVGNSLSIKRGAVLRNASGVASGQSIQLNGTISIYNGGRYIHASRSSHATEIVAKLSGAAGTEKGIFEFDVPGGSYPISISNRSFGSLVLSSQASGGVQTYNASGSSQAIIGGDFQLNEGVQFNLDFTNDMVIQGDFIQRGGVFNLASQGNSNVVKIKGDIDQAANAIITESSDGHPVLEFCGDRRQSVSAAGKVLNSITCKINNPQGVVLIRPLSLYYKLQLTLGKINTTTSSLLTLMDNCVVAEASTISFVDGPVKKIGDDDFEFPVGKQGDYAPIRMLGEGSITDEFIAEYFLGSAQLLYGERFESPPLVRVSRQEYWLLQRPVGVTAKKVGVYVGNYSNATSLEKLVVVSWDNATNSWKSQGNSFYSGVAVGTVVSNTVHEFGAFTLGSTVEMQNPLLVQQIYPYLQVSSGRHESVTVLISDLTGKRLHQLHLSLNAGYNQIRLQPGRLAKGLYILSVYNRQGQLLKVEQKLLF